MDNQAVLINLHAAALNRIAQLQAKLDKATAILGRWVSVTRDEPELFRYVREDSVKLLAELNKETTNG